MKSQPPNDPDFLKRLMEEPVEIVPYDDRWPSWFEEEENRLRKLIPADLIGRIEHFGSTAIPQMPAKPVIDMLVEVVSLERAAESIVPHLKKCGYDYIWRPTFGDDGEPFYHWFIRRNSLGQRTHHIHMVEPNFEHWERLFFRDYLIEFPDVARAYGKLKLDLSKRYANDRVAYTHAKTKFISDMTERAKQRYLLT